MNREELSECGTLRGWGRSTSAGSRRLVCSVRPEPGPVWARTSAAYVCLPLCASFVHPRHPRSRSTLSPFPAFSFVHVATINTSVRRLRPSAARPVWICTGCACLYLLGMSSLASVLPRICLPRTHPPVSLQLEGVAFSCSLPLLPQPHEGQSRPTSLCACYACLLTNSALRCLLGVFPLNCCPDTSPVSTVRPFLKAL